MRSKRIVFLMVSVLVFALAISSDVLIATASEVSVSNESQLNAAIASAGSTPTTVRLTSDISLTTTVLIPNGAEITIMSAGGQTFGLIASGNTDAIRVDRNASLTIVNVLVSRLYGTRGRGVVNNGTLTLNSGTISDNNAPQSRGGGVLTSGRFIMNGGAITGNSAYNGGGVKVESGSFIMNGGEIKNNTAINGGGVDVEIGSFTMNGGVIFDNTSSNGGGVNYDSGSFFLNGGWVYGNRTNDISAGHGGVFRDNVIDPGVGAIGRRPPGDIWVYLDGRQMTFDITPQIINGRTLVPLRGVFEALGASVVWDAGTQTVAAAKGDIEIRLTIGNTSPTVSGKVVEIDQPGIIVNGRTLVPLRFVGEALGVRVDWDEDARCVVITSGSGMPVPVPPPPGEGIVYLTFAHPYPATHFHNVEIVFRFADEMYKASNGRVNITVIPGGAITTTATAVDDVSTGAIDMTWAMPGSTPGRFPLLDSIELAGGFDSAEHATRTLWELLSASSEFRDEFSGYKVFNFFYDNIAEIWTEKPVRTPADLNGMNLRAVSPISGLMLKAYGVNVVPMGMPDVYDNIERGIISGLVTGLHTIFTYNLNEVLNYHTQGLGLLSSPHMMAISWRAWNRLSDYDKWLFDSLGGMNLSIESARRNDEQTGISRRYLNTSDMEANSLTNAEIAAFRGATVGVIDEYLAELSKSGYNARAFYESALSKREATR